MTQPDWRSLDKDLVRLNQTERTTGYVVRPLLGFGLALTFMALAGVEAAFVLGTSQTTMMAMVAAMFGAYLALNIGANDVANNMGPAVGAKALPMTAALIAAALAEVTGALLGGSEVVATVSTRLIEPDAMSAPHMLIQAMMSAMIASALWVNLATWMGAPVSTTQSIIGAILGATTAAAGFGAVDWLTFGSIATSWMLSPLIGAVLAMALLALIRQVITEQDEKLEAARRWVPILLAGMGGAFGTFFVLKLPETVAAATSAQALLAGGCLGLLSFVIARPLILRRAAELENQKGAIKALFRLPLVIAAILMSFAHGANDVANAIGPLASIVQAMDLENTGSHPAEINAFTTLDVPVWVLIIGAFGMAMGVVLFGPRLVNMVGNQITKLNPIRAYCVSTSAALTVIMASWLGLPVSSTHVAVGAVFGVGFYREHAAAQARRAGQKETRPGLPHEDRSRRRLVRRSHVLTILAAWLITVPLSGLLSAGIYGILHLFSG
ncbi:inorganic phosphate transporter [Ruegeria sp. TM1040]|jgi:PiT family inorganic phosphate transporter|uniref:inorganic phosphate transporter n=1 Tax=Rhodobacterales TaxID=204455 RepID=UPI00004625ED|nr:inorganic phosphate transporter [Ruegeria sp. TM1040]ABF63400.1 phosphate transporter [Ruegeria sp. TM1040]MDF9302261.1 inorganic phosphate transporter [Tritonibacter mobilis]